MNKNTFCSRKGGATVKGKFLPLATSGILAGQIERKTNKLESRRKKIEQRAARR